jgi:predicted nucleic acid-binding protein
MDEIWVLDSFAVLALLQEEAGSDKVLTVLQDAQAGSARVLMTWVNVGEVIYIVKRRWSKDKAHQVLGMLEATTLQIIDVDRALALGASAIKAANPVAYADAFAAALALREDATLITGDPEFRSLEDIIQIHWLPAKV